MNDDDFASVLQGLPCSDAERSTIVALARRPRRELLVAAALFALCGAFSLIVGYDGFAYSLSPPASDAPVPALRAYAAARQVCWFFTGIIQIAIGLVQLFSFLSERRRSAVLRSFIAHVAAAKCA